MTSASTVGLPLFQHAAPISAVQDVDRRLAQLLSILRDHRWRTAKELKVHGFSDRELRQLVEHSDGRILSFPGSPGYKLFEAATIEEIDQTRALLNQGRAMIRRFLRYKKRFHRGQ